MAEQGVLSQAEILTGLEYERLIALAQARVQTLAEAQGVFVGHLRRVHGCGVGWKLEDWAEGFVQEGEEEGGHKATPVHEEGGHEATPQLEEVGEGD